MSTPVRCPAVRATCSRLALLLVVMHEPAVRAEPESDVLKDLKLKAHVARTMDEEVAPRGPPPTGMPGPRPMDPEPRPPSPSSRPKHRLTDGVMLGFGLAIGVAGAATIAAGSVQANDAAGRRSLGEFVRGFDAAERMWGAGGALAGIGAVAAVAGVIVLALPRREDGSAARPVAWVVPTGHGLAAYGEF